MSEHELSILLRLRDEASKQIEQFGAKIQNEMGKAGKSMVDFGREISKIGRDMTFIGAAITGPLALAFKTSAGYSIEASEALKRLDDSSKAFQITIGNAMLPVVEKVSNVIGALTQWFERLNPKMRDAIIQGTLIAGIFLTLSGAITYTTGKVVDLVGKLLLFAKAHPYLLLISLALTFMIQNWEKVRAVAIPILNLIEIGVTTVAIGALKAADSIITIADAFGGIPKVLKQVIEAMVMAFGLPASFANIFTSQIDKIKIDTQGLHESIRAGITALDGNLTQAMQTGKGAVTAFFDESMSSISNFIAFFNNAMGPGIDAALQNFTQNFKATFTQAYESAVNLGQQSAQIFVGAIQQFSSGIGNAVADMFLKGKNFGESMKQVALQMAQTFISSVVSMVAQFLIFQAIQAAFFPLMISMGSMAAGALGTIWAPVAALVSLATMGANAIPAGTAIASTTALAYAAVAGPKFHQGGPIYAHAGLAVDEVPIIAQTGEGVLSRRGMAALGGPSALDNVNNGRGVSQPIIINNNIEINNPIVTSEIEINELVRGMDKCLGDNNTYLQSVLFKKILLVS